MYISQNNRNLKGSIDIDEPIAIVGLGMRLPGQVHTVEEFWEMLVSRRDGRCLVPATRYHAESRFSPTKGPVSGHFLQEDPAYFDAPFFSMSAQEAAQLDPQQRLLLEVVWECLENAGETNWRGASVGVYVGVFGEDWLELSLKSQQRTNAYQTLATGGFALSNRISYEFDLRGPSMTIQTGCSATMVGLHEACQALRSQHCSAALVAGTNLICTPTMTESLAAAGVLSPGGNCRTFDADANGYARGEAVNAIYIKRLSDALRAGDAVRAVIRSSTVNCDGKTVGMMNPSSEAQEALIRSAYQRAGLLGQYHRTGLFECHGTGTLVGDSMEATAIANVFGQAGVIISGVKPNVGHSEGASGLTSVIKAVMVLEHRTIPPNVHYDRRNPSILPTLQIPTELMAWPADRLLRVSINSFGVGGTNVHAILDSAAGFLPQQAVGSLPDIRSQLVIVSAKTPNALQRRIQSTSDYANSHLDSLANLSYTFGARRVHLPYRGFAIASPHNSLEKSAFETCAPRARSPVVTFVFTGQGAHWAGMGRELLQTEPHFITAIDEMDKALRQLGKPPPWSLREELSRDPMDSRISDVELAQPLCTALQIGLCNVLADKNIAPDSVIGHSSGEIAAAYAAGAISASCAIIVAFYRGQLAATQANLGAMAAVSLPEDQAREYLQCGVVIACFNSPGNVTLSGDKDAMHDVLATIKARSPDTLCRPVKNPVAYHSPHMNRIGAQYEDSITPHVRPSKRMRPMFSSLTGDLIADPAQLNAAYWRRNLESPVGNPVDHVFVEIGPHSALAAPLQEIFRSNDRGQRVPSYIPTLIRNDDDCRSLLLTTIGRLYNSGVSLDMDRIFPRGTVLTDIPRYPWGHDKHYWVESRSCRKWRLQSIPDHELLGSRVPESTCLEPSWRKLLHLDDVPWLADHVIGGEVTFPGTGYVAMAGEAVHELQPKSKGYSMRNVQFKAALLLDYNKETEVLTHLKPVEIADGVSSSWYQFTISAFNGSTWTIHCQGQVRAGQDQPLKPKVIHPLPRILSSGKWYRTIEKVGMECGPSFRRLQDITANPKRSAAVATVIDVHELHTSRGRYLVHPTCLDQCLQSIAIATTSGLLSPMAQALVPVAIEELCISGGASGMQVAASCQDGSRGHYGEIIGMAGQEAILIMNGVLMLKVGRQLASKQSVDLISRMQWKPDIDLVSSSQLLPARADHDRIQSLTEVTNFLSRLCILVIAQRVAIAPEGVIDLTKWKEFLLQSKERIKRGANPRLGLADWLVSSEHNLPAIQAIREGFQATTSFIGEGKQTAHMGCPEWEAFDPEGLESFVCQLMNEVSPLMGDYSTLAECLNLAFEYSRGFANGTRSPTEIWQASSMIEPVYDTAARFTNWSPFLTLLSHSNPGLRILEIGAGTGSATRAALQGLKSENGLHLYSRYVFTDASRDCISAAQDKFQKEANMEFQLLDIISDPEEQGFRPHDFDLVIVSYALHCVPSLQKALRNIRKLLCSPGRLLLHESTREMVFLDLIMGTFNKSWLSGDMHESDSPFAHPEFWDGELREAGFAGADVMASDPLGSVNIISSTCHFSSCLNEVAIVTSDSTPLPWAEQVSSEFERQGCAVQHRTLDDPPDQGRFVVCLLDAHIPCLEQLTEKEFDILRDYLIEAKDTRLLWVTPPATHRKCENPGFGTIHGLARTLRKEIRLDISILEVDRSDPGATEALVSVSKKINAARDRLDADQDYEFAVVDSKVSIPRSFRSSLCRELSSIPMPDSPRCLTISSVGHLETVQWVPIPSATTPLGVGEVEVEVAYVGLNFRDLLVLLGYVGTVEECGLEASGVVRQVGPGVPELKPGDRVSIISSGLCRTRVRLNHQLVTILPDEVSLQDAATMGVVYMTALYALMRVGNLQKGQSVLIHSAAGGVGIAAIRVCHMIGADIYATVGTKDKRDYLTESLQIPQERIFSSRDSSFLLSLMQATNGKGVDIVLNSLAGHLLHASWECVAPHGKMIELGKRDFLTHGVLNMSPFLLNRSFTGVDLMGVLKERPDIREQITCLFSDARRDGFLKAIRPVHVYEAGQAVEALRYLQTGTHMGKLVLRMPSDGPASLGCTPVRAVPSFRQDRSYLLVGGLGGIGRLVSSWLAKHGARSIVYLSRTAGELGEHVAFIPELEAQDCEVTCVKGSVTDLADVERSVSSCPRPLAGVIHMAGILKDRTFSNMTYLDWSLALAPKVTGTRHLHQATQGLALDFFVMFGSISGTVGVGGQANYAAANTFLDAFSRYRRSNGQVASVVNLGLVEEAGIATQRQETIDLAMRSHTHILSGDEVLDALHLAILESSGKDATQCSFSVGIGHTQSLGAPTKYMWELDARFGFHKDRQLSTSTGSQEGESMLSDLLARVDQEPTLLNQEDVVNAIKSGMAKAVAEEIAAHQDMDEEQHKAVQIDSLMAVEIHTSFRRSLKIDIPTPEILNAGKVGELCILLISYMRRKYNLDGNII
ncbi:polyketide synthase [Aspergillus insuetus]